MEAIDWDGPDDPENAQNWGTARKWFQSLLIAAFAFVATSASSIIVPGLDQIAREFGTSGEVARVAFVIYVLGLAIGAPVASPLSETFGRRLVYLTLNTIFAFFILGTGFANNITSLILCRFLAGLAASPTISCGMASISDIWLPEQRSTPLSFFVAMPFFGPAMGPLIGGFVTANKGWRWTSWTVLFFSITFAIPSIFMRESYKTKILQRRLRKVYGDRKTTEKVNPMKNTGNIKSFFTSAISRPFGMLFTEQIVLWLCLYVGYIFAMHYSFYTAFPYIFETYYNYGIESVALTFLGLATGTIFGIVAIVLINDFIYRPMVRKATMKSQSETAASSTSKVAPEHRLYSAMIGGPLITVSFFLFGWTAAYSIHWIIPVIAEGLFGCGNIMVFMSCAAYILDTYGPKYGASAIAGNAMFRYLLGFIFPLFTLQMYKGMKVQWACTLLGCISALGMIIPFLFFRFGPTLRSRIKYEQGY